MVVNNEPSVESRVCLEFMNIWNARDIFVRSLYEIKHRLPPSLLFRRYISLCHSNRRRAASASVLSLSLSLSAYIFDLHQKYSFWMNKFPFSLFSTFVYIQLTSYALRFLSFVFLMMFIFESISFWRRFLSSTWLPPSARDLSNYRKNNYKWIY